MGRKKFEKFTEDDFVKHENIEEDEKVKALEKEMEVVLQDKEVLYTNRTSMDYHDYLEFTNAATPRKIQGIILLWSVASFLIGLFIVIVNLRGQMNKKHLLFGGVLMFVGLSFFYTFFYSLPRKTAKAYVREDILHAGLNGGKTYRDYFFYDTCFRTETSYGKKSFVYYEDIRKIQTSKNLLIIMLDDEKGFVMKKESFTKGDSKQLIEMIKPFIGKKKNKTKQVGQELKKENQVEEEKEERA